MASLSYAAGRHAFIVLLGLLALFIINPVSGTIECEELPVEACAFAVSSSGARCVLEKDAQNDAAPEYKCLTSIIMAERPMEWIETEECISTCGLQRLSVGLSTDALLEGDFTRKLCFSECRSNCPNINDLYTKLAAEEGIYLPSLCDSLKPRGVRKLVSAQTQARLKQQQQQDASMQRARVNREDNMQSELAEGEWAPTISASPPSGGCGAEEPYPWAERPAYEGHQGFPPTFSLPPIFSFPPLALSPEEPDHWAAPPFPPIFSLPPLALSPEEPAPWAAPPFPPIFSLPPLALPPAYEGFPPTFSLPPIFSFPPLALPPL